MAIFNKLSFKPEDTLAISIFQSITNLQAKFIYIIQICVSTRELYYYY